MTDSDNDLLVSIIIPTKNEGKNVRMTVDSILKAETDIPFELIVIDDGSNDMSCDFIEHEDSYQKVILIRTPGLGLAAAKNLGGSAGAGDIFVFCDAHITVPDKWLETLLNPLISGSAQSAAIGPVIASMKNPAHRGYGQTWNKNLNPSWLTTKPVSVQEIPFIPGGCQAFRASDFKNIGGFDNGFRVWGCEDIEICLKLWLFGKKVFINPGVTILHLFRKSHPYKVTFEHVTYNFLRMSFSHLSGSRLSHALNTCREYSCIKKVLPEVCFESNVWEQREKYFNKRSHSDSWFFEKFKININN